MPEPIFQARTEEEFEAGKRLFKEYAVSLDFNVCFQSFEEELAVLPQMYGPPGGCLLLARDGDVYTGCVGLREKRGRDGERTCEMKRLYVRPEGRGRGLGRRLAEAIVEEAGRLGYDRMVLDTLDSMQAAQALYRSMGFRETTPFAHDPVDGIVYMERETRSFTDLGVDV